MLVVELEPPGHVVEGLPAAHVVHQQADVGILEVAGYEALKSLLSGSVPDLKSVAAVVIGQVLQQEVYADGCLRMEPGVRCRQSRSDR